MKRTNIYLTESQYKRLFALSDGRSVSEIIRRAIDEFLAQHEASAPPKENKPHLSVLSEAEKKRRAAVRRYREKILRIRAAQRENLFTLAESVARMRKIENDNPDFLAALGAMLDSGELE